MSTRKTPDVHNRNQEIRPGLWNRVWEFIAGPLRQANEHRRAHLHATGTAAIDWEVTAVMLVTVMVLTVQYYFLTSRIVMPSSWTTLSEYRIVRGICWSAGHVVLYVVSPLCCLRMLGKPVRDYGVKIRGAFSSTWLYVLFYVGMLPIIFMVAQRPSFQHTYPFYKLAEGEPLWPRFFLWEAVYAAQFVALEFFFRGFLLHGTKRQFGAYSILVMTIPYCMIHFQKPLPESMGAIVAGLVLGFMSLKTRSIWLGALLHIAVAWTMDGLAVWTRFAR